MKPYISTFVVSDDLMEETHPNNKKTLHIINPQNLLRPVFIPGSYSFAVSFGLLGIIPDKKYKLNFKIVPEESPDKAVVDITNDNLPSDIESLDTSLPPESNGFMINLDFRNVPFRTEGKYLVKILINDELTGEFPFLVYARERA